MIKTNSQYPTRIKFVKHGNTQNGTPTTKFSIGDKIKGSEKEYINYDVTIYANVNLNDGDEVIFTSIDSIESRVYNDKVYHSLVAKIATKQVEPPPEHDVEYVLPFDI